MFGCMLVQSFDQLVEGPVHFPKSVVADGLIFSYFFFL